MMCHANDSWRLIMIMSVTSSKSLDELDQDLRKQSSVTNLEF